MIRAILTILLFVLAFSGCATGNEAFGTFDVSRDESLTEDEVSRGLFNRWDEDDDNALTETEFGVGFDEAGVFDEWDLDDNNVLGAGEFAEIGLP